MKKVLSLFLVIVLSISLSMSFVSDANAVNKTKRHKSNTHATTVAKRKHSNKKMKPPKRITRSKTAHYYRNHSEKWSVTVTATFAYGNGKVKCTKAAVSTKSCDKNWFITSKSSRRDGSCAIAKATGTQYYNDCPVKDITKSVKISCTPSGQIY